MLYTQGHQHGKQSQRFMRGREQFKENIDNAFVIYSVYLAKQATDTTEKDITSVNVYFYEEELWKVRIDYYY